MDTLLEHLQKIGYNKNIARLCFYNYLVYFKEREALTPPAEVVQDFLKKILVFQYWRERFNLVLATLKSDLIPLHSYFENILEQFDNIEIMPIKNRNNFFHLCYKYSEEKRYKNKIIRETHFKILNPKFALLIHQLKTGGKIVETLPNIAMIGEAEVLPIGVVNALTYDNHFQIERAKLQRIQINPSQQFIFTTHDEDTVSGAILSGHVLN